MDGPQVHGPQVEVGINPSGFGRSHNCNGDSIWVCIDVEVNPAQRTQIVSSFEAVRLPSLLGKLAPRFCKPAIVGVTEKTPGKLELVFRSKRSERAFVRSRSAQVKLAQIIADTLNINRVTCRRNLTEEPIKTIVKRDSVVSAWHSEDLLRRPRPRAYANRQESAATTTPSPTVVRDASRLWGVFFTVLIY